MNKEKQSTKTKILRTAARLFAKQGFEGTSIRDIANSADVNVAAINYHFVSKDRLYWEVNLNAHEWLEAGIEHLAKDSQTTFELAWKIFEFLNQESRAVKNAFVMMISDSAPPMSEEAVEKLATRKEFGPPGGKLLYDILVKELNDATVPHNAITWAVKNIFSLLFHWNLMMGSTYCRDLFKNHPDFQLDQVKVTLRRHVEANLEYIQKHKDEF